jgi:MFS family permease
MAVPGAKRLLVSSLVGRLPLGMSLAVLLLVHDRTGSFADAGVVVAAFGLASSAVGPLLGRAVDALGQTKVLLAASATHGVLLTALVVATHEHASVPLLTALGAAAGACIPPIAPCLRTLWPEIAPDDEARESAFALDATVQEVIWTAGPLLVGGLVALVSPTAAVLAMAVVTVTGTAWFASSPLSRQWAPHGEAHRGLGVIKAGGMLVVLAASFGSGMSMGTLEVGLPGLAEELDRPGASGALLALASLGSLIGGLSYGARRWRSPLTTRYAITLATGAALMLTLTAAPSLTLALVLAAISSLAWAPSLSCGYALVGRLAPRGAIAEAFTWSGAAIGGGIAAGVALGGVLVEHHGSAAAFVLGAGTALAAALIALAGSPALTLAPEAP